MGIAGVAEITQAAYADPSQFNPESKYFDPKASPDNPRWVCVNVTFVEKFKRVLPLAKIKTMPEITELGVVKKGHRLSIMPVQPEEWDALYQAAKG